MSVSHWQLSREGELACEVAVVGAGIAGVSAALELERRGVDVVLLDARSIGDGASTRNAGYLMRGAADNYAAAAKAWGRDRARELWRLTEQNLEALVDEGVEGVQGFERRPSCLIAVSEREEYELRTSHAMLIEDGFDSSLIEPGEGNAGGVPDDALWATGAPRVGLVNPSDAVCDPAQLMDFLTAKLTTARVRPGVRVASLETSASGVMVRTSRGVVRAQRALVCTNALAGDLIPRLRTVIEPNRGQMLTLRPDPAAWRGLACAYYLDHGSEYIREPAPGLVCVGGGRKHAKDAERTRDERPHEPVQGWLESFASRVLGVGFEVVDRWAGTMGFTPDGLPVAGRAPGMDAPVSVCAGFTGHGMSLAFTVARETARAMIGDDSNTSAESRVVFDPARFE